MPKTFLFIIRYLCLHFFSHYLIKIFALLFVFYAYCLPSGKTEIWTVECRKKGQDFLLIWFWEFFQVNFLFKHRIWMYLRSIRKTVHCLRVTTVFRLFWNHLKDWEGGAFGLITQMMFTSHKSHKKLWPKKCRICVLFHFVEKFFNFFAWIVVVIVISRNNQDGRDAEKVFFSLFSFFSLFFTTLSWPCSAFFSVVFFSFVFLGFVSNTKEGEIREMIKFLHEISAEIRIN